MTTTDTKTCFVVIGTRPEAIKLAPVYLQLKSQGLNPVLILTGQHRHMVMPVLDFFGLSPDIDLDVMQANQTLSGLTARVLDSLSNYLSNYLSDYSSGFLQTTSKAKNQAAMVVQGDTTTSMAAALTGFYFQLPVFHVEAGLRTHDKRAPYPEEMNRRLTGQLSDFHFAPTALAKENLLKEGVQESQIKVVGNTVVDAIFYAREKSHQFKPEESSCKKILVTSHRREKIGDDILNFCRELKQAATDHANFQFVFPVHPNPKIKDPVEAELGAVANIKLLPPQSYPEFVSLMNQASGIVTDSGGVQEEASVLGIPTLVTRDQTERPEVLDSPVIKIVGEKANGLSEHLKEVLAKAEQLELRERQSTALGDGKSSERIASRIDHFLQNS